jgi:RNA polymerase sigma-70 factor, ECF subfamily
VNAPEHIILIEGVILPKSIIAISPLRELSSIRLAMNVTLEEARAERFLRFYIENQYRLSRFVHALVPNWQDAEELVQESLLILWRKFDDFDAGTEFFPWAARVAQFEILNYRRRQKHAGRQLSEAAIQEVAATAVAVSTDLELQREALRLCVEQLSERDRQIVTLRYRDESSVDAVALAMGRSTSLIHKTLRRIRSRLLHCVRRRTGQAC